MRLLGSDPLPLSRQLSGKFWYSEFRTPHDVWAHAVNHAWTPLVSSCTAAAMLRLLPVAAVASFTLPPAFEQYCQLPQLTRTIGRGSSL